jgi:hypothetical protein
MSLELFMQRAAQQQQREAAEIADSTAFTLEQALAYNKAKIPTARQSTKQIKNWYAQGYVLRSNNLWYSNVGGVVRRKYYTGN